MGNSKGIVKRLKYTEVDRRSKASNNKYLITFLKRLNFMGRHKKEMWKDIDDPRIKPIYRISSWGRVINKNTGKILKPDTDKDGYLKYTLQGYDKKIKVSGHKITALYFVNNDDKINKNEVNHKNLKKNDNYYENLEWVTHQENINHSVKHHAQIPLACAAHGYASMSNQQVIEICKMFEKGYSVKNVLNTLGYYKENPGYEKMRAKIKMIKSKKSWTAISFQFKF